MDEKRIDPSILKDAKLYVDSQRSMVNVSEGEWNNFVRPYMIKTFCVGAVWYKKRDPIK